MQQDAETSRWSIQSSPLRTGMRILLITAMIIFVVTVVIGLINGQHVVTLSQDVLLTHVHAGTLGWITLSVFAVGLWFFGDGLAATMNDRYLRWLSIIAAVAVPLYVLAFLSGNYIARAIFGVPVLLVILGFFGWIAGRLNMVRLNLARYAVLFALFTLILGALVGVLLQFQFATNVAFLPGGAFGAHPASLVAGYLILIGIALCEHGLMPITPRLSRLGMAMLLCFLVSGLALGVGLLLNAQPLLGLSLLLDITGGVLFLIRIIPRIFRVNLLGRGGNRFFAISAVFIVAEVVLTTVVTILDIITNGNAPQHLIIALDHTTFVGVMTNAIFGLIVEATAEQRDFWPWAEHVVFWGMNLGAVGFIISLIIDARFLEPIFTPIMGLSILLALVTFSIRMLRSRAATAVEVRAGGSETIGSAD